MPTDPEAEIQREGQQNNMVIRQILILLAISILIAKPLAANIAQPQDLAQQRQEFLQAETALKNGEVKKFRQLSHKLKGYPLYPYLEYAALSRDLKRLPTTRVEAFLKTYSETPLADQLRRNWLNLLAKKGHWKQYLAFYQKDDISITRRCHYLNALLQTGQKDQALVQVTELWRYGRSQPDACDPVFSAWRKAGRLTNKLIWERIELAMNKSQTKLARYLGKDLTEKERLWLDRWLQVHKDPKYALNKAAFASTHPYREKILSHAVYRMARNDALEAIELWKKIQQRYPMDPLLAHLTDRRISLALIRHSEPEAYHFLTQVQPCSHDSRLQESRLRAGLLRQDWQNVLMWLDRLSPTHKDDERWRYWRARALQKTGNSEEAKTLFELLAQERSYYGFLAADQIGAPYNLSHHDTPVDQQTKLHVSNLSGIKRARELMHLGRWINAKREWRHATHGMDDDHLKAAAKLAESWRWHDQAIFTLARSGYWNDLELRFPLGHQETVSSQSDKNQLDMAWVFAVIRQESAFNEHARSPVGALGLMQLMPATARAVAKKRLKVGKPSKSKILTPDFNIRLGAAYLRQMLDEFEQNPVLATAAYNAGPHRVKQWLPETDLPTDIWAELIPYRETRGYVRRVMAYTVIYEQRLGREPTRLSQRMLPILATGKLAQADL